VIVTIFGGFAAAFFSSLVAGSQSIEEEMAPFQDRRR
jgi:hypothetical protein